jgi:hypothetical protein
VSARNAMPAVRVRNMMDLKACFDRYASPFAV